MKIKQISWVLAAFFFTSVLYAQRGGVAGPTTTQQAPPQPQVQRPGLTQSQIEELQNKARHEAQTPQGPHPFSEKELTKEIKSSPADKVIKDVMDLGVDFDMTPVIEKKLRKAKATDQIIDAVKQAGPTVRSQMAKLNLGPGEGGIQSIPKEEAQGFDAIKVELDPDKAIGLVDDFAKKYPDSVLLSYVYSFGASAYQQKADVEKVVEYSSKSLKLKPDNLMSLVLSLGMLPQPQYLNSHPADRAKILQEAESEAKHALEIIPQIPKQPNETDADFQKRKAELASEIHAPLGMIHLDLASEALAGPDRAELAKAEEEFNTAVTTSSHPDPRDYYRMGEAYALDGKLDNALEAFTKASELGQGTLIKTYADQRIAEVKKKKAEGGVAPKS
jgi:tetratricopeptide (TPR) repeat protein